MTEEIVEKRKGMNDLTIKELLEQGITSPKDIMTFYINGQEAGISLPFVKIIKIVNYIAKETILSLNSTLKEVFEYMPSFL